MQEFILDLLKFVALVAAGFVPIGFFVFAGVVRHSVAKDNDKAGDWITYLFMAVWVLLLLLLSEWL